MPKWRVNTGVIGDFINSVFTCAVQFLMLLSQFMNASNLARRARSEQAFAARGLDQAAEALESRAEFLRDEAERIRNSPGDAVGVEQSKVSMLLGVRTLTEVANSVTAHADHLAASANASEMGVSSRMIATALGVSTNTAIKRMRKTGEGGSGA